MPLSPSEAQTLGEIHGLVKAMKDEQNRQGQQLTGMDGRLRNVEMAGAKSGMVSGGVVSIGMALLIEGLKAKFGGHGPA